MDFKFPCESKKLKKVDGFEVELAFRRKNIELQIEPFILRQNRNKM